jgi:hypothetical protein
MGTVRPASIAEENIAGRCSPIRGRRRRRGFNPSGGSGAPVSQSGQLARGQRRVLTVCSLRGKGSAGRKIWPSSSRFLLKVGATWSSGGYGGGAMWRGLGRGPDTVRATAAKRREPRRDS